MTVYRPNPLLMTVMGANPGPRRRVRRPDAAIDHEIGQAWARHMSGVQVSVMDIPQIFRDIKLEMAGGATLDQAVVAVGSRYRVNSNPLDRDERNALYAEAKRFHSTCLYDIKDNDERSLLQHIDMLFGLTSAARSITGEHSTLVNAIRDLHADVHEAAAQAGIWKSYHGRRFPPQETLPNPLGEAIVGGVAGALASHALQSNPGPSFVVIDSTTGEVCYTKRATGVGSEAISSCVAKAKILAQRTGRPYIVFLDIRGVRVGHQVDVGMVRTLGITEEIFPLRYGRGPQPMANPAIRVEWDKLSQRSKLAVLEFAGIDEDQAVRLSRRSWAVLPPDVQAEVAKGWRDSTDGRDRGTTRIMHRETVRTNPRPLFSYYPGKRPPGATHCSLCGNWQKSYAPFRVMKAGPFAGKKICNICYQGAKGSGESWAKNPLYRARFLSPSMEAREEVIRARGIKHALKKAHRSAERLPKQFTEPRSSVEVERYQENPGSKRKMTMTIDRFASWVKSKRDPAMWKAFLAKFRGYEKWTHGAKARKVTVEWVETPGVNGLWITYDGGKQPESTYIMPKGSPRTGAWKHPWDTMPDIKHDPEAKIVITKLRGSSKITDFYHK